MAVGALLCLVAVHVLDAPKERSRPNTDKELVGEIDKAVSLMQIDPPKALAEFRRLQEGLDTEHKHVPLLLFNSAEMAYATGDLVSALDYYNRLLRSIEGIVWPNKKLALAHKGRTLSDLGRAEEAVEYFEDALAEHLESPTGPLEPGFNQLVQHIRARSAQAHMQVGESQVTSLEAQINAGIMASQIGAHAESAKFLERSLKLDASGPNTYGGGSLASSAPHKGRFGTLLYAGKANVHLKKYGEAASLLSSAIGLRPRHADAYRWLAYAECLQPTDRRTACLDAHRATYAVRTTPESFDSAAQVVRMLKEDWRHAEAEHFGREAVRSGVMLNAHQYGGKSLYRGLDARPYRDDMLNSRPVKVLERNFEQIRAEVLELYTSGKLEEEGIADTEGLTATGKWVELNLLHQGRRFEKNLALLPFTAGLLLSLSEAHTMVWGASKVSLLDPGTSIRPHCGGSNTRMRIHLGLAVPQGASLTVGGETRHWEEGKCLIFDDSFEHSVEHTGSEPRLVLIVDVWHPAMGHVDRARSVTPPNGENGMLQRYLDLHQRAEAEGTWRTRGASHTTHHHGSAPEP